MEEDESEDNILENDIATNRRNVRSNSNETEFTIASERLRGTSTSTSTSTSRQATTTNTNTNTNTLNMVPYNSDLSFFDGMTTISIESLNGERPRRCNTVLPLQLIRIVSGTNQDQNSKSSTASYTYFSKINKHNQNSSSFYRMFLCRVMTSTVGEVVYIIESNHVNKFLWKRDSELRDNNVLTIGKCIAILNPLPIKALLGGKVPIIESRGSCVILKTPLKLKQVPLNPNIDQEATHAFVLNSM